MNEYTTNSDNSLQPPCKWRGSVRATAVRWDAVLAGDPKMFRLERIRIPCGYGLIYRVTDIINKTEISKYVSVRVRYRVTWQASMALVEGGLEAMAGREWYMQGASREREAEAEAEGEAGGVPLTGIPYLEERPDCI